MFGLRAERHDVPNTLKVNQGDKQMTTSCKDEEHREHTHRGYMVWALQKNSGKKGANGGRGRENVHVIRAENRYKTDWIALIECE